MKWVVYILALLLSSKAIAQPSGNNIKDDSALYVLDPRIQVHELKNHANFFIDSTNKLGIDDILAGKHAGNFQPLREMVQPAGSYVTYWIRIPVSFTQDVNNWWLLLNGDTSFKNYNYQNCYVDTWIINTATGKKQHQRTGVFVPRSQKSIQENPVMNRVFFSAKSGETDEIYFKIYNEYEVQAIISSPEIRNPIADVNPRTDLWIIFASGGVFFFALISFFFYFFVKEKSYLYFGFYAITLSQHYLILHPGMPFIDLYIRERPDLVAPAFHLLTIGGFILFALFGRYFINLQQLSKRLDKILKWSLMVWAISLAITLTLMVINRRAMFIQIHFLFVILFLVFILRVAFYKTPLVKFYVTGAIWLLLFTMLGLFGNSLFGNLPFNPWPIGQIGQILIYAAGLAYKVRLNEKARTQAELIRLRNEELASLYENSEKQKREIEIQKKNVEESLTDLKAAQTQLIQSEKMASLGELTAGIAHEIQNPLNFVNNFSEVSAELVDEIQEALQQNKKEEAIVLVSGIKDNLQKINHHGQRADAIIKSMLQHSRASSGKKESTDINALAGEYLRLSYHGLRAKDKAFNANFTTNFDESIGKIEVAPQDIGRVLLNLYTNAFYSVNEKNKLHPGGYEPTVSVTTVKESNNVIIKVKDNGIGIPQKLLDKIYQPFFTTKPTGQGTGLGLSMSYDIIKAHGGELKVETKEGEFAEFIIRLPVK